MKKILLKKTPEAKLPKLKHLISFIPSLKWRVLSCQAIPRGTCISSDLTRLLSGDKNHFYDSNTLIALEENVQLEFHEIALIGAVEDAQIREINTQPEIEKYCDAFLYLIDGEEWLVSVRDKELLEIIAERFLRNAPVYV